MFGALGAMMMPRLPAADPNRNMEWNPWVPVRDNLRFRRSRPLVIATIGIAFFTFMALFFRLILIFEGETNKDYMEYQSLRLHVAVPTETAEHMPAYSARRPTRHAVDLGRRNDRLDHLRRGFSERVV